MKLHLIISLLLLASCQNQTPPLARNWQTILSRDEGIPSQRIPLYRAKVPNSWQRKDPLATESLVDTRLPICEFLIQGGEETIRITVHSFTYPDQNSRIPPSAQLHRWQRQFDKLDPAEVSISPISQGGFYGLKINAQGFINQKLIALKGWGMQLASDYYRLLSGEDSFINRQKKSDYTIKASGPAALMHQHGRDIDAFASSFELIEELPSPL